MGLRLCYLVACRVLEILGPRRQTALDKDIELMVLRHQVRVLKRQLHGRVRYRTTDRAILAVLSRVLPRWRWGCFLVTPETLLRWHRELSRCKWKCWRAQRGPGSPLLRDEVELIVRLGRENRRSSRSSRSERRPTTQRLPLRPAPDSKTEGPGSPSQTPVHATPSGTVKVLAPYTSSGSLSSSTGHLTTAAHYLSGPGTTRWA